MKLKFHTQICAYGSKFAGCGKGVVIIMSKEFQRLDRTLVHNGKIIDYYQDTIRLPNGNEAIYDFIKHKGAAAMIAVREDGKLLMVRQWRNAIERYTLEIPAGGLNSIDEPTEEAAVRELKEETGYIAENVQFLLRIHTTVAFCSEGIDIYLATGLKRHGDQHLDEDEFVDVGAYSLDELVQMIYDGKIEDSKTICAIMTYKSRLAEGKIQ